MTSVRVDGLTELLIDLDRAAEGIVSELKPVVSKGALNIKRDWRRGWADLGPHITSLPRTIGYDLDVQPLSVSAIVGPDKDIGQGALGNIIEFGDGLARNAAHPAGAHALEAEAPRFIDAVGKVAADLLEGRR